MTFHIDEFLRHLRYEKRYSELTIEAYGNDLQEFLQYIQEYSSEISNWNQIQINLARSWMAQLAQAQSAPSTIKRKKSTVQSFYKFLMRNEYADRNPIAQLSTPKLKKRLPKSLDQQSIDTMISLQASEILEEDWDYTNTLLISSILFETGIRRMELCGIREQDIDHHRMTLLVFGKGNKSRILPLHPDTCKNILAYIEFKKNKGISHPDKYLFVTKKGNAIYPKYVYTCINRFLSGITSLDQKSPHVLRHTFATSLLNNGADINAIKDLLGHSSLAATQIYTHTDIESLKKEFRKAHPRS